MCARACARVQSYQSFNFLFLLKERNYELSRGQAIYRESSQFVVNSPICGGCFSFLLPSVLPKDFRHLMKEKNNPLLGV